MFSLDTCRQARAYANLDSISFMPTFEVKQLNTKNYGAEKYIIIIVISNSLPLLIQSCTQK